MQKKQKLIKNDVEAEMLKVSAWMELLERLDNMSARDAQLVMYGFDFRQQMLEALDEIFEKGD